MAEKPVVQRTSGFLRKAAGDRGTSGRGAGDREARTAQATGARGRGTGDREAPRLAARD